MANHCGIFIFNFLILSIFGSFADDFTYLGPHGSEHWAEEYDSCSGKYQSPININVLNVKKHLFLPINYTAFEKPPANVELLNNGHTVVMKFNYGNNAWPNIENGPLVKHGKFRFAQLHFHWGANNSIGSEDRINNQSFPAELHMVFFNEKYANLSQALTKPGGVAVLASFYVLQAIDNENYSKIVNALHGLRNPGSNVVLEDPPALDKLLYDTESYFTYTGSLTTPPCSEEVIWIDFATPIPISEQQIMNFRQLLNNGGKPMVHNYRPLQPLNNRIIYKNFILERNDSSLDSSVPFFDIIDDKNINDDYLRSTAAIKISHMFIIETFMLITVWCYFKQILH